MNTVANSFLKTLDNLDSGHLTLTTPDGKTRHFEGKNPGETAHVELRDWRVINNMLRKGDVGFAEDYRAGHWETDNLPSLVSLGLANKRAFDQYVLGNKFMRFTTSLGYLLKLNTLKGSKKNIHAHYDLGNEFYKLWLDPSMTYSSALYKDPKEDLTTAQHNKYDRIIDHLGRKDGTILEVGCGWGGFAERALQRGDYGIKGITLSQEQHDFARHEDTRA